MLRHLWQHFVSNSWAAVSQVTVAPGDLDPSAVNIVPFDGPEPPNTGSDRRIDLLAARRAKNPAKAGPFETLAIEVKVTRSDFLSDVKNPAKQEAWKRAATRHTYAVPAGLVQASEVPPECGLLWVTPPLHPRGFATTTWVKRAPYTPGHRPQLPLRVLVTLVYRLASLDGRTRGWQHTIGSGQSEEELRAALTAAQKRANTLEQQVVTYKGKADAWKLAYAATAPDGVPCGICGRPVKPLRPNKEGRFATWRHVSAADDTPCEVTEAAQAEAEAREDYAAADTAERERRLRVSHRFGLNEAVEAEPWRAWLRPYPAKPAPHYESDPT